MPDLLIETAENDPPRPVDVVNRIAERRMGKPGWVWCRSGIIGRPPLHAARAEVHFLIEGEVPIGLVTRGKNKGNVKWPRVLDSFVVSGADIDAEVLAVEAETGKCHPCAGTGREVARVVIEPSPTSYEYRTCRRCQGNGKPRPKPEFMISPPVFQKKHGTAERWDVCDCDECVAAKPVAC